MNEYKVSRSIYNDIKLRFGMEFFHRVTPGGDVLIRPLDNETFKRMEKKFGKDKFEFIRFKESINKISKIDPKDV